MFIYKKKGGAEPQSYQPNFKFTGLILSQHPKLLGFHTYATTPGQIVSISNTVVM